MRIAVALLGALALQSTSWGATPSSRRPSSESWRLRPTERLLTTPPMVIHFGWGTSDISGLIHELSASAAPQLILAERPGVLEYVCSPKSIIPWGASLFRIYELDLLSDLREAEEAAAQIGALPVVVAPRNFPSPTVRSSAIALPPPLVSQPSAPQPAPGPKPAPPDPLVKLPRSSAAPGPSPGPAARQRATPTPKPRESLQAASEKLSAAEERIQRMAALVQAAETEVRTAEQTVAPLKEDVAARRRLADAGVIARNDVKAAEERLAEVTAAAEAARSRVAEAQEALRAAEAERDAALAGLERARIAPVTEEPRPAAAAPKTPARRARPRPGPGIAALPPALPEVREQASALDFPSPTLLEDQPPFDEIPPPEHSFSLAPRRDVPGTEEWEPLPLPDEAGDLTRPRWYEQMAPYQCVVARALLPQGARVTEDTPVLELRKTSVGRVRAEIDERYVSFCRVGAPVKVVFPHSRSVFVGCVSRVEPTRSPRPPGALVEMLLVEGTTNAAAVYADLEWLSLAAPMLPDRPEPLVYRPPQPNRPSPTELSELFPLGPAGGLEPDITEAPPDGRLSGSLQFVSSKRPRRFQESDPVATRKLRRLRAWRRSFIDGMKTTVFPETGLSLTYPREGEVCRAVERMATRRVSHQPNMCAKSLAEAFGWGLGDAAMWARRLPERGYKHRKDGIARPGDIVVWPFTYGPSRSQHVGIAVAQGNTMMLLSNEGGVLGTTPLKGGYLAYYKPRPGDAFAGVQSEGRAKPAPPERPPDASRLTPSAPEGT
jgi:hypothetical protein